MTNSEVTLGDKWHSFLNEHPKAASSVLFFAVLVAMIGGFLVMLIILAGAYVVSSLLLLAAIPIVIPAYIVSMYHLVTWANDEL